MNHIDEQTIELYILGAKEIEEHRSEIKTHLQECAGCMSLYDEIAGYYAEVQQVQEERTKAVSQALTVRAMAVKAPTYTDFGPLSQIQRTWPARLVLFIIRHPYVSAGGFVTSFGFALMLAVQTVNMKAPSARDTNPAYARAKDEFLEVYNKEGVILWRKHVGPLYDAEALQFPADSLSRPRPPDTYLRVEDIDNDGTNEVLAVFGFGEGWPERNAVLCYRPDGVEKWKFQFSRNVIFGNETFTDPWHTRHMVVCDRSSDGTRDVVASLDHGGGYFPQPVVRLDGASGYLKSEYWHSGTLWYMTVADIDSDGVGELVCAGENNGFNLASVAIFDLRLISGHSPDPTAYTPEEVHKGSEKYYLLCTRSDMGAMGSHKRNIACVYQNEGAGKFRINVGERVGRSLLPLFYHFNARIECTGVDGEDMFVTAHERFEAEGKLTRKLDDQYWEELRRGVLYWNGEKFVKEPVMNHHYLEALKQLTNK